MVEHGDRNMRHLAGVYLHARETVVNAGFGWEIDWQDARSLSLITESGFLREAAWVVISAGMSERVVRGVFPKITRAFCEWTSARAIVARRQHCMRRAGQVFGHERKLRAIADIATTVDADGFDQLRTRLGEYGVTYLQQLPYIGPVTSYHLAKNIGMDVAKPDRHLVRIARAARAADPVVMCRSIAEFTGDRLATVDVVLWRFATLEPRYEQLFTAA